MAEVYSLMDIPNQNKNLQREGELDRIQSKPSFWITQLVMYQISPIGTYQGISYSNWMSLHAHQISDKIWKKEDKQLCNGILQRDMSY